MGVEKSVRRLDSAEKNCADLGLSTVFLRVWVVFWSAFLVMIKTHQNNYEIQDRKNKKLKNHNEDKKQMHDIQAQNQISDQVNQNLDLEKTELKQFEQQ